MLHSILNSQAQPLSSKQLETILERKNELEMIDTMKAILQQAFTECPPESYILPIIKNVSPSQNKTLKRILHLFWPLVPFYDERGVLKPYTILICNSILSDLKHPNEFIEISALRCVASLEVRKVVQNVVQGIPLLLRSEIQEVRAAAGFCCLAVYSKFPGLVSVPDLISAAQNEKVPESAAWILKAACKCDEAEGNQLIKTYLERFEAFTTDYQIGSAIFECFDYLSADNQEYLVQQIQTNMDTFNPIVLSSAGMALKKFPLQSALCLLQSCKNAPEAALLMVVDELQKMDIYDNIAQIVQALCYIFILNQSQKSTYKLLKSHILLKFSESDAQSAKVIVDALISSRILETTYCDLYLELINTVLDTAEACQGYADISLAGIQEICQIFGKNYNYFYLIGTVADGCYLAKIHAEACQAAAKLLVLIARASKAKSFELAKLGIKFLANCVSETGFRALSRAVCDMCAELDPDQLRLCVAGFIFVLKLPLDVEIAQDQAQKDFLDTIAQNESADGADDEDAEQQNDFRIYYAVRAGKHPFLALCLIKAAEKLAFRLDWQQDQFYLTRLILGASGVLRYQKMGDRDLQMCSYAIQRMFIYAKDGTKPKTKDKVVEEVYLPVAKAALQDPSQSIQFSIIQNQEPSPVDIQKAQKFENFQTLSQDPRNLARIHQLSADADLVYSEAIITLNKQQVTLHVLFVNRTGLPMSDVELELFAPSSIKIHRQTNKLNLEPNMASFQSYYVSISKCEAAVLYGNILCKVQQRQKSSVGRFHDLILRIYEIRLPISNFLKPFKISMAEFQREWEIMEWESRGNLNASKVDRVAEQINASTVSQVDCDLVKTSYMSCISVQNEMCLAVLNVVDGRASVTVKGNNKELVRSIVEVVSGL